MENMDSQLNSFRTAVSYNNIVGRTGLSGFRLGFLVMVLACTCTVYLSSKNGAGEYSNALIGSNLIFFALWLEQVLLYSYQNSFYFKGFDSIIGSAHKNNKGITYEVAETLLGNETDVTKAFLLSTYGKEIMIRTGVDKESVLDFLKQERQEIKAKNVPLNPEKITSMVDIGTYIYMYDHDFHTYLNTQGINSETFFGSLRFVMRHHYKTKRTQRWWSRDELSKHPAMGRKLSTGKAFELERFSHNLNDSDIVVDHTQITKNHELLVNKIEHILSRNRAANVLLIGTDGTGTSDLINTVQKRVQTGSGLNALAGLNFLVLDTEQLFTTFKKADEIEREILFIFDEAANVGNLVIVIENISSFIKQTESMGILITELMDVYLALTSLHFIAIDSASNYHSILKNKDSFVRRFEEVIVESSDVADTMTILEPIAFRQEKRRGVMFTFDSLFAIASSADRYILHGVMPERAIDLIHEISHEASNNGIKIITGDFIYSFVSKKTGIPVGPISSTEREKLLNLEDILHTHIVGQSPAISAIARTMRRARVDVNRADKPIGSFLFLGPTGVGKTETAKALAVTFFGDENKMIRLDMSEFSGEHTLGYLIGDENGSGILTDKLNDQPYGVLLLDEFEKSAESVKDLFLQILDEGYFTSHYGAKVNARNIIIIATSNVGSDLINRTSDARAGLPTLDADIITSVIESRVFKQELINRFDNVIIFEPLNRNEQGGVADLLVTELIERVSDQGYHLEITAELKELLLEKGYSEEFGARSMNRVLQNVLEEKIAQKIISGQVEKGDDIILAPGDFSPEELQV